MTHPHIRWTLVPLLAAGGFASSIYTLLLLFRIGGETNAHQLLYTLLGSATFGLTLLAVLWYRRHVRSWQRGAALLAVVIAAHAIEPSITLSSRSLLAWLLRDVDLPAVGTVDLLGTIVMLAATFVVVLGVLIVVLPERRHIWTPAIAAVCAAALALAGAYIEAIQHGAWITFWNAEPLWPFWQTGIAAVVGIALCVADVALSPGSSSAEPPKEHDEGTLRTRLAAAAVLVSYAIVAAIVCVGLLQWRSAELGQRERQAQSDIARSIADAPSAAVPMVTPKPLSQMLLQEVDGQWTPFATTWSNQAMEAAVPGVLPPLPHRIVYSARYARQSTINEMTSIQVTVTEFPSAVWAAYYLHNIPSPNAQFHERESFTTIQRDGNLVHQLWMDSFWSSGSDLVVLHCEGTPPQVIDLFLKAYLQKYPSSIERR